MIISIHQPNFIPWIGFFYKIYKSDKFVLLDNVQYTKNSYINRNRIKTPQGVQWITLPVKSSGSFGQLINEVEIHTPIISMKKVLGTIRMNYSKSFYFKQYFPDFENLFMASNENLSKLNISLIRWIVGKLDIKTEMLISSELRDISGESNERLISICNELGADKYLHGFGASNYQDQKLFEKSNIQLLKTDFIYPDYQQLWGEFVKNVSIIDMLFNVGTDGCKKIFN